MEKSFRKFLIKMFSEKYPMVVDIHVVKSPHNRIDVEDFQLKNCYEVYLVILKKDWDDIEKRFSIEVKEYVKNLAKYMGLTICGIFPATVDEYELESED